MDRESVGVAGKQRRSVSHDYGRLQYVCLFLSWVAGTLVAPGSAALVGRTDLEWIGVVVNIATISSQVYSSLALVALNPVVGPVMEVAHRLMLKFMMITVGSALAASAVAYAITKSDLLAIEVVLLVWAVFSLGVIVSHRSNVWPPAYGTGIFVASMVIAAAVGLLTGGWLHGAVSVLFCATALALPAAVYPTWVLVAASPESAASS